MEGEYMFYMYYREWKGIQYCAVQCVEVIGTDGRVREDGFGRRDPFSASPAVSVFQLLYPWNLSPVYFIVFNDTRS